MTARLSLLVSILICYFTAHFIYGAKSKHHRLVTLTPAEYNEWYTKDERDCINELPNRNGSCIITENCRSPIHNRIFWKKGIQGFTYPREHTIINLWTQLWGHKRNITIIFIGDFSTKQRIHFMNLDTARFMGADFIHRVDVKEEAADEKGNHFRAYFFSKELNSTVGKQSIFLLLSITYIIKQILLYHKIILFLLSIIYYLLICSYSPRSLDKGRVDIWSVRVPSSSGQNIR